MPQSFLKQLQIFVFNPTQFWPYPRLLVDTLVSGLVLCMVVIMTLRIFGVGDDMLYGENGVLETLQVIALAMASIVSVLAAVRLRPAGRFVATTTALICLMFFVREIPSCHPDVDLTCVPPEAHRIVPAVCGSLLLLQAFMMYRTSVAAFLRIMHPAFSWPLMFVAILLVLGEFFEELDYQSLEEISELVAYNGLFLSSAWMLKSTFQARVWQTIGETGGALLQRLQTSLDRRR